jgi:hypothetical protein
MIGNDFVTTIALKSKRCSECGAAIPKGSEYKESRHKKTGKVTKVLCMNEDCRLTFDDRIWQEFARRNRH